MFRELFLESGGKNSDAIWENPEKISRDKDYIEFINTQDPNERSGHYAVFASKQLSVVGQVGSTSRSFQTKGFRFGPGESKPTTPAELKKFLKKSGAMDFIIALNKAMNKEKDRYRNYMSSGGVKD